MTRLSATERLQSALARIDDRNGEGARACLTVYRDEAIAAADTLLLTVPNQLGVEYNAQLLDNVLRHVAPSLGWR